MVVCLLGGGGTLELYRIHIWVWVDRSGFVNAKTHHGVGSLKSVVGSTEAFVCKVVENSKGRARIQSG